MKTRIKMNLEVLKKVLNYYPDTSLCKFYRGNGVIHIKIKCEDKLNMTTRG